MKSRRVSKVLIGLSLAVGAVVLRSDSATGSHREVLVRAISKWDGGCDGGTRNSWDNMAAAWYNDICNPLPPPWGHGGNAWQPDGFYHNGNIVDSDFCDTSQVAFGKDHLNDRLDDVDVAMIALHGGEADGDLRWVGSARVNEAGDGNCNAYQGHMEFGDGDLEFLHLSSCHSMCRDVWWPEWSESFRGLHQINGFHGLMWISSDFCGWYEEFADDAFDIPIVDAWIDNMYENNISGSDDECPVSRGVGSSQANLWSRMDNEQYNNVFSDPTPSWQGAVYIKGCDPASDPALPN